MELKKLNWKVFLISFFIVGFVVFALISILDWPWIEKILLFSYKSQMQKEYGIALKNIELDYPDQLQNKKQKWLCVSSLVPGGKAETLGFEIGDVLINPVGCRPAEEGSFYWLLAHSNPHESFSVWVIKSSDMTGFCIEKARRIELNPKKKS
ncbi:MAG TPA: hypothetical protein PLA03_13435 [Acidobacteriota bacterium]|nr:hypothetical protein [Acidobacteriota bacterium]